MAYIYELGYGSYEESEFAQLQHRRKFSQSRFEKMVMECVVQAARMEVDVHQRQWSESWDVCHEFEKDERAQRDESSDAEPMSSRRKSSLESAMSWRLDGKENMYLHCLKDAYVMNAPRLSYQTLHKLVVWLMCENYGFKPVEKLRTAYFFGWSDLSIANDWRDAVNKKGLTARATRLVRKFVTKHSSRFGRSSAEAKWSTSRERVLRKNPAGGDNEDKILCEELGVEFIPYDHELAVQARNTVPPSDFMEIDDDLMNAFSVDDE